MTTNDLIHISYSGLSSYMQCSLKYKLYYVDHAEPDFVSSALVFGHSIHEALSGYLQTKQNGDDLKVDQMLDVFKNAWYGHEGPRIRFAPREDESSLMEKATNLLSLYRENYDPESLVLSVEEPFAVDLEKVNGESLFEMPLFTGVIDSIVATGGVTSVIDYKTSSRKPNGSVNELQLIGYSFGARELGFEPDELEYRYEYLVKTAKPEFIHVPVKITEEDRKRFIRLVARVWQAIKNAVFFPNPNHYCGYCGYHSQCRAW